MELSVNTDFIKSTGDVSEPLKYISEAGFNYIHWCHHLFDDYLYSYHEVKKIGKLLKKYNLKLYDLHASHGIEKYWCSTDETKRLAGEELLLNRIRMTHDLGGRAIVLHTNTDPLSDKTRSRAEQGVRTLSSLEPHCRNLGIRIGIENLYDNGGTASFYDIDRYFSEFSSDYIGFCWDTGHSNMVDKSLQKITPLISRLLILHLNDNNSIEDEHLPLGEGNVDVEKIIELIAGSSYDGALTQEVNFPVGASLQDFLEGVYKRGSSIVDRIEKLRTK